MLGLKGNDIRVWGDKWFPMAPTHKVISLWRFLHLDTRVGELINFESVSWNLVVIDALFYPYETDVIKSLPLSSWLPQDKPIWVVSPNGSFSVRSTYTLAVKCSHLANIGASSDNSQVQCFWRNMWSLPVPHKIWHFVWRSCRDILPMKTNLMRQKVVQDGICDKCRNKEKTPGHVLWNCQKARETWECSKVASFGLSNNVSFHDFLWQMIMHNRVEEDRVAKVVNIAWALWWNRNKVQNGGKWKIGRELFNWAAIYLDEYTEAIKATCKPTPTVEFQSS